MPAISNIQTGSLSVTSTALTFNVTLGTAVDLSRAIVFYTHSNGDAQGRNQRHFFSCQLTSTTNIQFIRNDASFFSDNIDIEWTVIEFATTALQSLQSGIINCTAANTDITLGTPVDITKTIPIFFWEGNAANLVNNAICTATLVNSTTLRFSFGTAPTTGTIIIYWQLLEFKSADVVIQSGLVNMPVGTVSTNVTLTAVDLTKTLISHGGFNYSGSSTDNRLGSEISLTSTTNLLIRKANIGADVAKNVAYYVIEFNDGVLVNGGEVTILDTAQTPAVQPSFTALDTSRATVWNAHLVENWYDSDTVDASQPTNLYATCVLNGAASGVTIQRQGTAKQRKYIWQVVQWNASGGGGGTETGTGAITFRRLVVSGSGKLVHPGSGSVGFKRLGFAGNGALRHIGSGAVGFRHLTIAGVGNVVTPTADITGVGAIVFKHLQLAGIGNLSHIGSGAIDFSKLSITGIGNLHHLGNGTISFKKLGIDGIGKIIHHGAGLITFKRLLIIGTGSITPSTHKEGTGHIQFRKLIVGPGIGSIAKHHVYKIIDPQIAPSWVGKFPLDFLRWLSDNFNGLQMLAGNNGVILFGNGVPEGFVTAKPGTMYLRQDGGASSTMYVKETGTGNTGWVAK